MICPNINTKEWKHLVASLGEDEAYRIWFQNNGVLSEGIVKVKEFTEVADRFSKLFNVPVIIDYGSKLSGKVTKAVDNSISVVINPDLLKQDTVIHEFAHIYIDLLGGLDNPQIKAGIRHLRGTHLEDYINEKYSDKTQDIRDKEMLATAIGIEGYDIFKEEQAGHKESWRTWLSVFLSKIASIFGIHINVARNLAREMVKGTLQTENMKHSVQGDYEQRTDDPVSKRLSKKEKLYDDALALVINKISNLERVISKENEDDQLRLNQLEVLKEDMAGLKKLTKERSLVAFVNTAYSQTKQAKEEILSGKLDKSRLVIVNNYIKAFDTRLLKEIKKELLRSEHEGKFNSEIQLINNILLDKNDIEDSYKEQAKDILIDEISSVVKDVEIQWRLKAKRLYAKQKIEKEGVKRTDLFKTSIGNVDEIEFINSYINEHKEEIDAETREYVERQFDVILKDVGYLDHWFTNPKDINNALIRFLTTSADKIDYITTTETADKFRRADAIFKAFTDKFGVKKDQKEQWAMFLQKDPSGKVLPMIIDGTSPEGIKIRNGAYGKEAKDMYEYIYFLLQEKDKMVGGGKQLGLKLPSIPKKAMERIAENGMLNSLKEGLTDLYKVKADDTEFGESEDKVKTATQQLSDTKEVIVDESGKEKQFVPLYFRNKIDEKDQSFDILTLTLLDYSQSLNYKNKRGLAFSAEIMMDQLKDTKVAKRSGLAQIMHVIKGTKTPAGSEATTTNLYANLQRIIEHRLYGKKYASDSPEAVKIMQNVKKYTSHVNLLFNWMSVGSNWLQGNAAATVEGHAGVYYNKKQATKAAYLLAKDFPQMMADHTRAIKKSKTNMLLERMFENIRSDVKHHSFANGSFTRRNANLDTLYTFNQLGEIPGKAIEMYSVLENIKAKNDKGLYLKKDGTTTSNREEAMSMNDAYEISYRNPLTNQKLSEEDYNKLSVTEQDKFKDVALRINPKVKSFSTTQGDLKTEFELTRFVQRVDRQTFGNYSTEDKSVLSRTLVGALIYQNRNWFFPGTKSRFKGGPLFKSAPGRKALGIIPMGIKSVRKEELRPEDLSINQETGVVEEGSYITTARFLLAVRKDILKTKGLILSQEWATLTDIEKANIRRTVGEMAIAGLALSIALILKGMDDDDDDLVVTATYFSRRLYSEMVTYWNPVEWQKLMRSPSASLNLLESTTQAMFQLTDPTELYETGRHTGESKLAVKWLKLTPLKSFGRDIRESLNFIEKGY